VVDDEPDMLDFIERATRRAYEVVRCSNGEDALALLATARFDLSHWDFSNYTACCETTS